MKCFRLRYNVYKGCGGMANGIGILVVLMLLLSCSGKKNAPVALAAPRDSLPVMDTEKVTTLISDSGVTRYRIETEEWLVYDRKNPSYWAFEKGLYLEKFDTLFRVEASIQSDTAYYYDKMRLWKLQGHVDVKNQKGERFNTELLFWDQNKQRVYSDRFIRIEQPDRVITGYGFESNQEMTIYTIYKPEGIFYVDEEAGTADSVKTDSVQTGNTRQERPDLVEVQKGGK